MTALSSAAKFFLSGKGCAFGPKSHLQEERRSRPMGHCHGAGRLVTVGSDRVGLTQQTAHRHGLQRRDSGRAGLCFPVHAA